MAWKSPFSPTVDQLPIYDRLPGVVAPYDPGGISGVFVLATAGSIYGCRVTIPSSGVLRGLTNYHGVVSGNLRLGVYDTGNKETGKRTLLYDSGSTAVSAGENKWQTPFEPALTVTAGETLDLVLMADNTTASFGRRTSVSSEQFALPTGYLPVSGGASPKIAWVYAAGAYAGFPLTITEAQCSTASGLTMPFIMARVSPY